MFAYALALQIGHSITAMIFAHYPKSSCRTTRTTIGTFVRQHSPITLMHGAVNYIETEVRKDV
jgi:hypothetical protein